MTARIFDPSSLKHLSVFPMPRGLRRSIQHAERLAALLGRLPSPLEATVLGPDEAKEPGSRRVEASAWLLGREAEIECFVLDVTRDVQRQKLRESDAAGAIDAYLTALHKGLARHFGERFPTCCAASSSAARAACDSTPTALYGASSGLAQSGARPTRTEPAQAARRARANTQTSAILPEDLLAGLGRHVEH